MKSLHLTNAWHANSRGIRTFYRALLEAAERRRHFMRLIVPSEQESAEDLGDFARIYRVGARRAPFNAEYRTLYPDLYLLPSGPIQRIVRDERPDLIEINDKYTLPYFGGLRRERILKAIDYRPTVVGLSCERMDENIAAYLLSGNAGRSFSRWYMNGRS